MVGKAFNLREDALPRISSTEFASLEKSLGTQLRKLYEHVETPISAPWKPDFASVYFIVYGPLVDDARAKLKGTLGARLDKIDDKNSGVSLFAVPTGTAGKYYKVEVHEVETKAELECTKFYLSYGDLGPILSLLARIHGFTFGTKGLKTHYIDPNDKKLSGFVLSDSPEKILHFFNLHFDTWNRGFKSQEEVFAWVHSSRLFNATQLVAEDSKHVRKTSDLQIRPMYYAFTTYATAHKQSSDRGQAPNVDAIREDALLFFNKKGVYDEQVKKNLLDRARREKFNGRKVMDWTNLAGLVVREIMNKVRERVGVDGIISLDEKTLKEQVLQAQKEVPLKPQVKKA